MFEWSADDFIKLAQFLGFAVLGAFWLLGSKFGGKPTPGEKTIEVAGALVDNGAIDRLTVALTDIALEFEQDRDQIDKNRALGFRLAEAVEKMARETEELRRVASDLANQVARYTRT